MRTRSRAARRAVLATGLMALTTRALPVPPETARPIPPPAGDEAPGAATAHVAVFAGGCFRGVRGVFQHVTGVIRALSGDAGGDATAARHDDVSRGTTHHAEAVEVTFDPRRAGRGKLLHIDTIEPGRPFYPAATHHQDDRTTNPTRRIMINDLPKIAELKRLFAPLYRESPIPVPASH